MIQKSIKIALQRLRIYSAYSAINIIGLSIAMMVCVAILSFARYHYGFDSHITNVENSYRIITRYGGGTFNTNTFAAFDNVLEQYPEIESFTTCYNNHHIEEAFVNDDKVLFNEAVFIEESFLDYFSIDVTSGDSHSISNPNTMMVTPSLAARLFPDSDPLGQTIQLRSFTRNQDSLITYTITGIVAPFPESSHLKYEALLSVKGHFDPTVKTLKSRKLFGALIYLKLVENTDVLALEERLQSVLEPILGMVHGPPLESINHKLQPVKDIHFTPGLSNEPRSVVRRSSLNILLLVGLLVFIIAIMNFVIMHIARSTAYYKTNMVIRFLGGTKRDLFFQTLFDVALSMSISFYVTIIFLSSMAVFLNACFPESWSIPYKSVEFWFLTISLFLLAMVLVSILSSISLFKAQSIIDSNVKPKGIKAAIPLVVFQFILVVGLSGFTMQVNRQMNYIEHKEQGYSSENIVVLKVPQLNSRIHLLRQELISVPGIEHVATVQHYPGGKFQDMTFTQGDISYPFVFGFADKHTLGTLGVKPVKYFTDQGEDATDGWIINETFYQKLRAVYSDEQIATGDFMVSESSADEDGLTDFVILGVAEDFHYASLHSEIESFAYYIRGDNERINRYIILRFNQYQVKEVLKDMEAVVESLYPGYILDYTLLNEKIQHRYRSEKILLQLINIFSVLAVFVACLGLIGLSIFISEKRSKEIGIRKVNGAKSLEILILLNKDILKWVCIAIIIATPVSWYYSNRWMEGFAYRSTNNWWIFVLAGILAIVIALITVSWQTFRSARKNPVESLKYE